MLEPVYSDCNSFFLLDLHGFRVQGCLLAVARKGFPIRTTMLFAKEQG